MDVGHHISHELFLFTRSCVLHHLLQQPQQPELHHVAVELLVGEDVEHSIDSLGTPFLQP